MSAPTQRVEGSQQLMLMLVLAALLGGLVTTVFTSLPSRAQEPGGCAQWEVATFMPNTDDMQVELLPLGIPRAVVPQYAYPFPTTEDDATFTLPAGWEPIGMGAAAGQSGEAVVLGRRCAG